MATTTPLNGWPVPTSTDYVADGAVAIEALGDAIDTSIGTGLLAWTTWTPVLQAGFSGGNGVWTARYAKVGKTVHLSAYFVFGSTTVKGAGMDVSLPFTAFNNAMQLNGSAYCVIAGNYYPIPFISSTTTLIKFKTIVTNGTYGIFNDVTASFPAAWATNDVLYFGLTYQAA
jgi:hypothetical protein